MRIPIYLRLYIFFMCLWKMATTIVFPCACTNIFWQFGVVKWLQSHRYHIKKCYGVSAGAISAALLLCNIDLEHATQIAMRLYESFDLEHRTYGLIGIWGYIVRLWLNELLPDHCATILQERLFVTLTPVKNLFSSHVQSTFTNKQDVIDCIMASCHIPFLLDLAPFAKFRNRWYVDGGISLAKRDYPEDAILFDYTKDTRGKAFMTTMEKQKIYDMIHRGYTYCERTCHFQNA